MAECAYLADQDEAIKFIPVYKIRAMDCVVNDDEEYGYGMQAVEADPIGRVCRCVMLQYGACC